MDHKAFIKWLEDRLEEYRARAMTSDNERFHFDSKAAEVAAILDAVQSDTYCVDRADLHE